MDNLKDSSLILCPRPQSGLILVMTLSRVLTIDTALTPAPELGMVNNLKFLQLKIAYLFQGLVGMLLRNEIDCIAADLTVTAARLSVMDFSKPFMSSSITFLLQVSNSL